jgi:hypothetical protein
MKEFGRDEIPVAWGSWEDAEALQRWTFIRKTAEQRLDWLMSMLRVAHESGAIKSDNGVAANSPDSFTAEELPR